MNIHSFFFFRPGIPSNFLGDFCKKVPSAIFTTNPCRIQYCSQEIVVFREDIISKMCRNSIYTPWEHEEKVDIPNLVCIQDLARQIFQLKSLIFINVNLNVYYNIRFCLTLHIFLYVFSL